MQMMCQNSIQLFYFIVNICLLLLNGHNVIGMCPRGCKCDDTNHQTVCSSVTLLEFIPHTLTPQLKALYLSHNHIKSIKSSLTVYEKLEILDISNNEISQLEDDNFVKNKHLQIIAVNHNNISKIQNNTFKSLGSLMKLQMCENMFETLEANIFKYLINLEILDLSYNRIYHIERDAFNGLSRLKSLYLRGNQLNHIPSHSFIPLTNVSRLDLGMNDLLNISDNAFSSLTSMDELCLDSCAVRVIQPSSFEGLNLLSILRLQDNNLEEIPSEAFSDANRLEVLQIGQNSFHRIHEKAFSHLQQLKSLEINNALYLSQIDDAAFEGIHNLERLEISQNKLLTHIDRRLFYGLPNLRYLNLRGNSFVTLDLEFERDVSNNVLLDVRDNPFTCNCSLQWLRSYLMSGTNSSHYFKIDENIFPENNSFSYLNLFIAASKVICDNPPALKDKLILALNPEEFNCFQLETQIPIIIAIIIGILVLCGVIIIFVIRCKYRLAGIVKNQWFSDGTNNKRNDLNYRKPDFPVRNVDINIDESNRLTAAALEDAVRYPLKLTPITEL